MKNKTYIIINNDILEKEPKKYPLYKQYGSFYSSDIYKYYNQFHIRKDILYVINCYNLETIPKFETYEDFINSNLSNPIQELLMISGVMTIKNSDKLLKDKETKNEYMEKWFNEMKQFTLQGSIYKFISTLFKQFNTEVHVLTSKYNLGIARSRGRAIDYIQKYKDYFINNGLTHVLMLDDSDFIGFINNNKDIELEKSMLYRQCNFVRSEIKNKAVASAARCSYWQHLIPIDNIEYFNPLLGDLAEDVKMLIKYSYALYPDHFVDYSAFKSGDDETKQTKMNIHYNPPILFKDGKNLVSYDIEGNKIVLTDDMLNVVLAKYSYVYKTGDVNNFILNRNISTIYSNLLKLGNIEDIFDSTTNSIIKFYSVNPGSILLKDYKKIILSAINSNSEIYAIVNNSIGTDNLQLYSIKNISDKDICKYDFKYRCYINDDIIDESFKICQLNFKYDDNSEIFKCLKYFMNKNIQIKNVNVDFKLSDGKQKIGVQCNNINDYKFTGGNGIKINVFITILLLLLIIIIIVSYLIIQKKL